MGFTTPFEFPKNATAWDYMSLYDEASGNDLRNDLGVPGGLIIISENILRISKIDPDAFITIMDAKEILGEGFQNVNMKINYS